MSDTLYRWISYCATMGFVASIQISIARWFDPSFFTNSVFLGVVGLTLVLVAILASRMKDST